MRSSHLVFLILALIFPSVLSAAPALEQDATTVELRGCLTDIRGAHEDFASLRTPHYAIIHPRDTQWAQRMGALLEKIHGDFYRAFEQAGFEPQKVPSPMVWVYFHERRDFDQYALNADRSDMSWLEAYYSTRTNRVAIVRAGALMKPAAATPKHVGLEVAAAQPASDDSGSDEVAKASHEAAHQLAFNSGIQKRGVMYPFWAVEGLSTNFETASTGDFGLNRMNAMRCRQLIGTRAGDRLMPLDDLVCLTRLPVDDAQAVGDLYAQAWGFFRFLLEQHPRELRSYYVALHELETGRRSPDTLRQEFEAAFGPIPSMEPAWREYVASVTAGQ